MVKTNVKVYVRTRPTACNYEGLRCDDAARREGHARASMHSGMRMQHMHLSKGAPRHRTTRCMRGLLAHECIRAPESHRIQADAGQIHVKVPKQAEMGIINNQKEDHSFKVKQPHAHSTPPCPPAPGPPS